MRRLHPLLAAAVLLLTAAPHIAAAANVDSALAFFHDYVERSNAYDPTVAELFDDSARIITLRDGSDRLELSGEQWKELVADIMPVAKQRGDTNRFDDVKAVPHGEGFRITASRTPRVKCVTDDAYHMDVVPAKDSWRIVEMYTETVSLSQCEPSDELARQLAAVRDGILPQLPLDLDEETRLEEVEVIGPALVYRQRLHATSAADLDPAETVRALHRLGFQYACGVPEARALVDAGATIRYETRDKDGKTLARIDVAPGMCP